MVTQIQEKISGQRKKIVPVLIALSLLSGVLVSLLSTPNAQADYYKGCGYGYNSSAGGFGYGTGFAFGYGYGLNGLFGYGYGSQVCPPPTTTTTLGGGGGGGGGTTTTSASSTTTTTAPTSTTTAPNTTTTAPTKKVCNLFARKVTGYAVLGRSVRFAITGCGFHGQPKITSNGFCTRVGVLHDYGKVLIVRVTVCARSSLGWHTFKIRLANGKSAKVNYRVISGAATKSLK